MKKTIKALGHGIKAVYTAIIEWLYRVFGMYPERTPENAETIDEKQRKDDVKYARSLRIIVSSSFAVIVAVIALTLLIRFGQGVYWFVSDRIDRNEEYSEAYLSEGLSDNLLYYKREYSSYGFLTDSADRMIIDKILWIAKPMEGDSLVCYNDGEHRGYFHMRDGRLVVPPTYDHAWIFSEGLAAVEKNKKVKFINTEGKIVIDKPFIHVDNVSGYVFHKGHCAVHDSTGKYMGIIDRNGEWVVTPEYERIYPVDTFWIVRNDHEQAILTFSMDTVMPMTKAWFDINDSVIYTTLNDHTLRVYSLKGELINNSLIQNVYQLMYETDELVYPENNTNNESYYNNNEPYSVKAVATCMKYEAEYGWFGLMSPDGRLLTPPSFFRIEAVGKDLYLCEESCGYGILINSKGQQVK